MNWKNDPNLSAMSDNDHLAQVAHSLTETIHANPNDARAWFLRGNAYLDRGANEFAVSDYSKAIELVPDDAVAYNNRGIAYRNSVQTELAIADYNKAIELVPDYRDAHNNLGMALSDKGDYEEAISHFTRAIELDSNYWYAYNNRGMALWAVGRRDDGIRDYESRQAARNLHSPISSRHCRLIRPRRWPFPPLSGIRRRLSRFATAGELPFARHQSEFLRRASLNACAVI